MADYYVGEIRAFAGTFAPQDWMLCNGAILPVTTYQALFAVIGTKYGGNGTVNFGLPDLRGRLAVSQGQGTGLSSRIIGSVGGVEAVALAETELPVHNHNFIVSTVTSPASVNIPTNSSYLGAVNTSVGIGVGYLSSNAAGFVKRVLNTKVLTETGGSGPHANVMPFLAINYIICINGLYPVRS